ncbi:unnamed protein product [Orchesella dallaii]|uniref:Cation efflux protein transmembrane domain-containing protein n=1 Tax=Orchesella dallaii TaxID=48710 RepID=A0ABP1Q095_9HEXA
MRWKGETSEKIWRCQAKVWRSVTFLWSIKSVRRKIIALPLCLVALILIASWTFQSNSCALGAFLCLVTFDVLTLLGDIFSHFYTHGGKQSTTFSFGYVRVEVLTHFSILCLGLLLNVWAVKNSLTMVLGGATQEIHTGRFLPTVIVGGLVHFFLSFNNSPFIKVYKVSASSTTLQKYFQGICASFGFSLSSSSTFSLSPLAVLGVFCCNTVILIALALQSGPRWFDFVGGLLMVLAITDALWPLTVYTGQVLLQTVPPHTATQLEQAVREAMTIDGVLEFRNELFWTLSYGQIAGTVHVRVRRDANEQLVLSKVYEKLQPLAPHLTVQVIKDDFNRPFHAIHMVRDSSPLTKVTVAPNELTPIPKVPGALHNVIYSTSSVASSHIPYGANQMRRGNELDDSVISATPRSSTSSVFQLQVEPNMNHLYANSHSTHNNIQHNLHPPPQPVHSPIFNQSNGMHNPFVKSNTNNVNHNNLLLSSANFYPE